MKKIAIHSVPRSGSSWIGQIFNSSPDVDFKFQPLFSYAFKDYLDADSSKKKINEFFELIAQSEDEFLIQKEKVLQGIYPKFHKNKSGTHVAYKEVRYHHILENMLKVDPDIIVIGIIRNPYAVVSSFLNAPREFRKDLGWDELSEWRFAEKKNLGKPEEFNGYEKWKEVALLFNKLKKQYPDRFYIVKYAELLRNTVKEVENMFTFCGIKMENQTISFLQQSTQENQENPYSVYKNKHYDNNWVNTLDKKIIREINNDLMDSSLNEYMEES